MDSHSWSRRKPRSSVFSRSFWGTWKIMQAKVLAAETCQSGISSTLSLTSQLIWWRKIHHTRYVLYKLGGEAWNEWKTPCLPHSGWNCCVPNQTEEWHSPISTPPRIQIQCHSKTRHHVGLSEDKVLQNPGASSEVQNLIFSSLELQNKMGHTVYSILGQTEKKCLQPGNSSSPACPRWRRALGSDASRAARVPARPSSVQKRRRERPRVKPISPETPPEAPGVRSKICWKWKSWNGLKWEKTKPEPTSKPRPPHRKLQTHTEPPQNPHQKPGLRPLS